jgi:ribosomal protein S27E
MKSSDNVIQIENYSFKIKHRRTQLGLKSNGECLHEKLILDQNGKYVECGDCGKQVSTFWALEKFVHIHKDAWDKIRNTRKQLRELAKETQYLKVLKELNRAWRGKHKMAVCCPHCNKGILPEDGLGTTQFSAELEIKRRQKTFETI